jgi:hypothetical protein
MTVTLLVNKIVSAPGAPALQPFTATLVFAAFTASINAHCPALDVALLVFTVIVAASDTWTTQASAAAIVVLASNLGVRRTKAFASERIRSFPFRGKSALGNAMNRTDGKSLTTVKTRMFGRNAQFAFAFCFVLLLSPYRSALVKGLNAWRERKSGATYVCCIEFLTLRRI